MTTNGKNYSAGTSVKKAKAALTSMSARTITQYALLISIMILMTLFPIGYIKIGLIEITLMHIPVIIGAILFGVKGGAILGFFFGVTSLVQGFMAPSLPVAMVMFGSAGTGGFGLYNVFLIIMVIFVPRILVGIFAALIYRAFIKRKKSVLGATLGAIVGSLTNTVLFLGLLYILARSLFAEAVGVDVMEVAGILFTVTGVFNGLAEAICAVAVAVPVSEAVRISRNNREYNRTIKSRVKTQIIEAEREKPDK